MLELHDSVRHPGFTKLGLWIWGFGDSDLGT